MADETSSVSAEGLGGRLTLTPTHVEIQHFGLLHVLFEFLTFHTPRLNVRISRREITAVEVVCPVFLPDYLVISYAGAPDTRGGYLRRAFASNALMMNVIDNRDLLAIIQRISPDQPGGIGAHAPAA